MQSILFDVYGASILFLLCCFFVKKISLKFLINYIFIILALFINYIITKKIQGAQIVVLSLMALHLMIHGSIKQRYFLKLIMMGGIALSAGLLVESGFALDSSYVRNSILFGPNTDALLTLFMLLPMLLGMNMLNIYIYLLISLFVVFVTGSRSSFILLFPVIALAIPKLRYLLISPINERKQMVVVIFIYLLSIFIVYICYALIPFLYQMVDLDVVNRREMLSVGADFDRYYAFFTAETAFLSGFQSILFGANIAPVNTNAENSLHSEIFTVLFSGGLVIFIIQIILLSIIIKVKTYFSALYLFTFFFIAGFSTTLFNTTFFLCLILLLNNLEVAVGVKSSRLGKPCKNHGRVRLK